MSHRITIVIEALDRGGAEWHLLQVLPRLRDRNFDVEVFCLHHRGELAGEMERRGVRVIGTDVLSSNLFLRALHLILKSGALLLHLMRNRPDIVHFFLPAAYIFGAPAAVLSRCRIRLMSRRSQNRYHSYLFGTKLIERLWHRRMSAVIGNSRSVVQQLSEEGVPDSKLHLLYNGADLPVFGAQMPRNAARDSLGLSDSALVFVIVANLLPYKGHKDLLQAFAHIKDQLPQNWVLLCAGRDDGIGSALQDQVEQLGLTQRVHWLGSVKDVPSLLAAADVALLTSHEEGFSNAIIEYMATGLPSVVTDVGGNPEAVLHEETGLVVPARDPAALAEAILRLAGDPELRRRFGAAAHRRVHQNFSLDACVDNYVMVYSKILREHGID
ncbi:MAG: glycosyltransferase [Alphaproteobacteria bacterium]|nr:glycosyltransferase [Alphaproteobacteria bacterium]